MARRKIGALWSKKTDEGKGYLTGVISDLRGDIQIAVCTKDKKTENQPDYDILLSEYFTSQDDNGIWKESVTALQKGS
jgi:uncharacterized protein (DUF736 family)